MTWNAAALRVLNSIAGLKRWTSNSTSSGSWRKDPDDMWRHWQKQSVCGAKAVGQTRNRHSRRRNNPVLFFCGTGMQPNWVERHWLLNGAFRLGAERLYASLQARYASEWKQAGLFGRVVLHRRIRTEWRRALAAQMPWTPVLGKPERLKFFDYAFFYFVLLWFGAGLVAVLNPASGFSRAIGAGMLSSFIGSYIYFAYFSFFSRRLSRAVWIATFCWMREEGSIGQEEFGNKMHEHGVASDASEEFCRTMREFLDSVKTRTS